MSIENKCILVNFYSDNTFKALKTYLYFKLGTLAVLSFQELWLSYFHYPLKRAVVVIMSGSSEEIDVTVVLFYIMFQY